MKLKYEPATKHFRIVCNETLEEKNFETEPECVDWASKVAHTFTRQMTFTITKVIEATAEIWADYTTDAVGNVR